MIPRAVHLYEEPSEKALDLDEIARFLRDLLPSIRVSTAGSPFMADARTAEKIAGLRVMRPDSPGTNSKPLPGEIDCELWNLRNPENKSWGMLYDGLGFVNLAGELIGAGEGLHIVFTNQLLGTFDKGDGRWHARVIILGNPAAISTTGAVEAPARPREYYRWKALHGPDKAFAMLRESRPGRFLEHGDPRLTEVLKGYALQAIFYFITGNPFCGDRDCRLFNAHWQEDMIRAQIDSGMICRRCMQLLGQQ